MARTIVSRFSPVRGVLGAVALVAASATLAFAGGPGSDHDFDADDDPAEAATISDSSGPDDSDRDDDNSGSGGGDDSGSGSSGNDDSSGSGGGDDSGSGSGGDDDSSGSDGGDDSGSGSGGGNSGSGSGADEGEGEGESGSGSNSGSSGHGGGDDDHSGGNSGSSGGSGYSSNAGSGNSDHANSAPDLSMQARLVERDDNGEERVAGEALLTGSQHDIDAVREAGFIAVSQTPLASLDSVIARLSLPQGMSVEQALVALHALAPDAIITANTVYHSAQSLVAEAPARRRQRAVRPLGVLGIIDTGVDPATLAPNVLLSQHAFAGRTPAAREHGSVVTALAVSQGMRVHVADVFEPSADGNQVASAESIAAALDWMLANNVTVINVSIEGPNNAILQALVRRAVQRGHVIVAAAGNGGPLASPAFPAAFDGSVAVTAIDAHDRPYIRANRGSYIAFAAQGVGINVTAGDENLVVSGTSFAAPMVAARIAARMGEPSPERAREVLRELREGVVDLGAPGRDPIFGWGALRH